MHTLVSILIETLFLSEAILMTLFNLNYFLRGPISKYSLHWELGLQHVNLGETQTFIYNISLPTPILNFFFYPHFLYQKSKLDLLETFSTCHTSQHILMQWMVSMGTGTLQFLPFVKRLLKCLCLVSNKD